MLGVYRMWRRFELNKQQKLKKKKQNNVSLEDNLY